MSVFTKIYRIVIKELRAYSLFLLRYIPGAIGCVLRYISYKGFLKGCGRRLYIPTSVFIKGFRNITIGDNVILGDSNRIYAESKTDNVRIEIGNGVTFNSNVMVNADQKGEIIIEDDVMIGPNVVMRASGHEYKDPRIPIRQQGHTKGRIVIKEGAWIGANAVILPNVIIGRGAVIGAGAVVTKDVADLDIVGGVPAKKISSRNAEKVEIK